MYNLSYRLYPAGSVVLHAPEQEGVGIRRHVGGFRWQRQISFHSCLAACLAGLARVDYLQAGSRPGGTPLRLAGLFAFFFPGLVVCVACRVLFFQCVQFGHLLFHGRQGGMRQSLAWRRAEENRVLCG